MSADPFADQQDRYQSGVQRDRGGEGPAHGIANIEKIGMKTGVPGHGLFSSGLVTALHLDSRRRANCRPGNRVQITFRRRAHTRPRVLVLSLYLRGQAVDVHRLIAQRDLPEEKTCTIGQVLSGIRG